MPVTDKELMARLKLRTGHSAAEIRAAAQRIGLQALADCARCVPHPCETHRAFFAEPVAAAAPESAASPSSRAYTDAFVNGIRDVQRHYVLLGSITAAGAAIGRACAQHALDAQGQPIRGGELLTWIRTRAAAFARTIDPRFARGGITPAGFVSWLNERANEKSGKAKKTGLGSVALRGWT